MIEPNRQTKNKQMSHTLNVVKINGGVLFWHWTNKETFLRLLSEPNKSLCKSNHGNNNKSSCWAVSVFSNQCFYVVQYSGPNDFIDSPFWSKNLDLGLRLWTTDNEQENHYYYYTIIIWDSFVYYKDRNFHTNLWLSNFTRQVLEP